MPFGFWHKCFDACLCYIALHNLTGAIVDSQIYTHITSISKFLLSKTLAETVSILHLTLKLLIDEHYTIIMVAASLLHISFQQLCFWLVHFQVTWTL
jgi:hypothetical protein